MRTMIDGTEINDFTFQMEFDSGGNPEYSYCVWIYQGDESLLYYDGSIQARRYFKTNYSKSHFRNFCIKFANNKEYRDAFLKEKRMY
ncbi:hypothetical protein [Lederbergia citri]|uniref:Uncharacterized protein n=1 Tax=Lederbergia citri TaxID=2833580 RepID=A0A942T956_9BACI|nr:hypothetical protein [Lederbergia citri]MBS4193480.1 hypothetical protein [Lederbergia citri]